jgi:hypothetical protein
MAVDFPLESLDPETFEQIAVALCRAVIGNGVTIFGRGPDGGREATYEGPVRWSNTTGFGDDSWDGYVVVQAFAVSLVCIWRLHDQLSWAGIRLAGWRTRHAMCVIDRVRPVPFGLRTRPQRSEDRTAVVAERSEALDQSEPESAVRLQGGQDRGPGQFAGSCHSRLGEWPRVVAIDQFDARGVECIEVLRLPW